jgi:capsular polysaccharide biosynthesis protein
MNGQIKWTPTPTQWRAAPFDSQSPTSGGQDPQLRDILRTLGHIRARLWLVFICALMGAMLAGVLSHFVMRHYTAQALLLVNESDPNDPRRQDEGAMDTHIATLTSQGHLTRVLAALEKSPETRGRYAQENDISRHLVAMQLLHSHLIAVNFTARSPKVAAAVANEIAQLYVDTGGAPQDVAAREAIARQSRRVAGLEDELRKARAHGGDPGAIAELNRELNEQVAALSLARSQEDSNSQARLLAPPVRIYALAAPPERPSSLRPILVVIPALLASALFGVALAALLGRLDRRIHNLDDVRHAFSARVAGALPPRMARSRLPGARPARSSAYDSAMEELVVDLFINAGRSARNAVMVTELGAFAPTDFALDLAQSAARMGDVLLLVVGDAALANRYSDAILGSPDFARLDLMSLAGDHALLLTEAASGALARRLEELRANHAWIVLAVPPPAKSPAARILAGAVDSIIVDVATESTTYQDVAAALAEVTRIAEPWTTAAPHAQPVIVLTAGRSSRMSHSALRKREVKDKIRLKTDLGQDSGLKRTLPAASETAKKPKTSDMEKDGEQGSDKTNVAVEGGSP